AMHPLINLKMISHLPSPIFRSSSVIYFSSNVVVNCSIVSVTEPRAIMKKLRVSVKVYLPYPSAMFLVTDLEQSMIWEVNRNFSCDGYFFTSVDINILSSVAL